MPMVGRQFLLGGWPFSKTLKGLGLPTGDRYAWPAFTPLWTLSIEGLCTN